MKIYVVIAHEVIDFEDSGIVVRPFSTKKYAQRCFDGRVEDARKYAKANHLAIEESGNYFYAYLDGCSSETHLEIEMQELELN